MSVLFIPILRRGYTLKTQVGTRPCGTDLTEILWNKYSVLARCSKVIFLSVVCIYIEIHVYVYILFLHVDRCLSYFIVTS